MKLYISEVLIIGPIPPFLKESHLAANPGAVVHHQDQGGGGDDRDDSDDHDPPEENYVDVNSL